MVKEVVKSKGQRSKEKIMRAAIDLIFKKGYSDTSAQDIADVCGISQTTVFYHYKSKQKLYLETLHFIIDMNHEISDEDAKDKTTGFERLKSLLISNVSWSANYPEQMNMIVLLYDFATYDEELQVVLNRMIGTGQKILVKMLEELDIKFKLERKLLAKMIQQYVHGVMFQVLVNSHPDVLVKEFEIGLDHYLKSLLDL